MKKRLLATVWLMLLTSVFAITSMAQTVTVEQNTAGGLGDALTAQGVELSTIKNLKVTGKMSAKDWTYIKNNLTALEELDISGTDLKTIPDDALSNNPTIAVIHLPSTVTTIGNSAFYYCQQLTTVDGCENVKEIGSSAFGYCPKLSVFPFGDAIQKIDSDAFMSCSSLPETLVLPASFTTLGWTNVFNESSVRSFDLSLCTLTGEFAYNAFGKCTSLVLPEKGDYRLGYQALKDAELTELRLPAAISYVYGEDVLPTILERLYVGRSTPIQADNNSFSNIADNCTLYIPVGSKDAYEEAKGWSNFYTIVEQGIKVNITGYGSVILGTVAYSNGAVFFANQGSATTLKLVPDKDNNWISVKLDGNALEIAGDDTFTIPAGTTIGTLDVAFTNKMLTIENPNGGELKDKIAATGLTASTIRAIKVVGKMAPKDWTYIKNNLTALEALDVSETDLKSIPEEALSNHQTLASIYLPSTVISIGNSAFYYCKKLTTVEGFENIKEIGQSAFNGCVKLSVFPFGNAIQKISYSVFSGCSSLPESLVMPASLTSIESNAFYDSSVLSFDLSQCTLTNCINDNPFGKCTSLALPEKGDYCLSCNALKEAQLTELRIPAAVNSINCESVLPTMLERLYVSRTVPVPVDNNALKNIDFDNCTLFVPVGSKDAYETATGWSNFTNVVEQGIKVNISGFGSVMQGSVAYTNGAVIFANQGSATTLKLVPDNDNNWISVKLDGNVLGIDDDGTFTIPAGTTIGTLDVAFTNKMLTIENPNGGELKDKIAAAGLTAGTIRAIKVVGKMAAKDWSYVKSSMTALEALDVSETDLKSIPDEALSNHQTLANIYLPSTVISIGNSAFYYCQQLTTVNGFENVKEINQSAFSGCVKLSDFPFGNAIQKIYWSAFNNCSSLPESLVMPASLTSIEGYAFYDSSVLSFDLSQCTLTNCINDNPFGKCTSLILPEKGDYCLSCNALKEAQLTELRLPSAVNGINCENTLPTMLVRLYVSRTEPVYVDNNALKNIEFDNCTLYVPVGSKDAYEAATGWSAFTKVKEYGMTVVVGEQGKVLAGGQTLIGTTAFFPTGNTATFEIVPNAGWHANAVKLDGADIPFANNKFTLSGDQLSGSLSVSFAVNQFKLQLQIAGSGKVKYGTEEYTTNQELTVDSLTTLNLTLEPAEGQMVSSITFNGEESVVQNGGKTYVTPAIIANSTLVITFGASGTIENAVTFTVNTGEGGRVEYKNTTLLSPQTTVLVPKGQDAVFSIKPDQYYIVDVVKLNDKDVTGDLDANGNLTVKDISADAKLDVTFKVNAVITVVVEAPETLTNLLTDAQKKKVTKLIVKGVWLSEKDFYTMRDEMPLLEEIDLWESETDYIAHKAFCTTDDWNGNSIGKKSLTKVRLPQKTKYINNFSFAGCTNLKEVNFTELTNLENIYSQAFQNTNLQEINLSNTKLTELDEAFKNVKNIENIKFPQTITRLNSFFYGTDITEIDLSGLTNLKVLESTFSECKNLVKVTLPEGLININYAFNGCEKLSNITLPKSLQTIGNSAFSRTRLQKVDLSGLTELQSIGGSAFSGCPELSEISFPASLEQVSDYAFSSCDKLTTLDLSNTQLQKISEYAFSWCYNLESVKLPNTLETIGKYAFDGCNKLDGTLELGSAIKTIDDYSFSTTKISIIRIDATVPPTLSSKAMPETWVATYVPKGYANVYKNAAVWGDLPVIDDEVSATVTVSKEGNLAIDIIDQTGLAQATITHLKVNGPLGAKDFEILRSNLTLLYDLDMSDADVKVIPEKAFLDKKILMNVKLPASLRTIESDAFKGCISLNGSLVLPDGLTFIGERAFQGCSALDEVVLNENLEVIQGYAFEGCSSLAQEITLPANFQSLGERAFANCSSLYGTVKFNRDFYMFMGTEGFGSSAGASFENCSGIEIVDMSAPDFLDEIPYCTFSGCTSLRTVLLPPILERIDNNAFTGCTSLDGIEFPSTLKVINSSAFQDCTSLSSIDLSECKDLGTIESFAFSGCSGLQTAYLPKNLIWIRERAFKDCRNLANLTVEAVDPADLGDYVFEMVKTDRCVLSIPTGTYYDYLTAPQWGAFVSMRKSIDVTVGDGANLSFVSDEAAAARGVRRAADIEQQGAKVKDGSSLYVQENETAVFKLNPDENVEISKVLFNGKDVTSELVNGTYETPSVTADSKFEIQVKVLGDLHVKELRVLDDNVTIKVAEKRQLKFTVNPTNATNKDVAWTSSDEKVATVSAEGIVTGVAAGNVEITGKTVDGGIEAKCKISVTPNKYWIVMDENVAEDIERYVELPLALHNEEEARDIQFDVWMPEGMYMDQSNINLSERASGYQVSAENISNRVVRVKVTSKTISKFKDSEGELLTLPFNTGDTGGELDVLIRNVHITGPDNVDFTAPNHTIGFSIPVYPMGDANGDGKVTINDAVVTVDRILGRYVERFFWSRANVYNEGDINDLTVADATGIVDIILERPSKARAIKSAADVQGRVYMDDISVKAGEQQKLGLQMENAADFIAFQCDVYLPAGMNVARDDDGKLKVALSNDAAGSHIISANMLDNGAMRIVVISPQNDRFVLSGNNIVNLTVMTDDALTDGSMIDIRNVRLVKSSGNSEYLASDASAQVRVNGTTAIEKIQIADGLSVKVEGHYLIVDAASSTFLQLVSTNGISKNLKIHEGENRIFVENAGVYIIGNNKLIIK